MVKCAWFRSKSFGFASSILALFSFCFACIAQCWQSGALVMLRSGIQSSVQAFGFLCPVSVVG